MLVFGVVFVVVIDVDDTDDALTVVGAVDISVVLVVFCGQDQEKWPICLQCQHCGFWPSTTTIIA